MINNKNIIIYFLLFYIVNSIKIFNYNIIINKNIENKIIFFNNKILNNVKDLIKNINTNNINVNDEYDKFIYKQIIMII